MDNSFNSVFSSNEALGETELLYTARGDQGMGTLQSLMDTLGVETATGSYDSLFRWHYETKSEKLIGKTEYFGLKRPLFTIKAKPAFSVDTIPSMVSIPQYSHLANRDIDKIALMDVLIWVDNASENHELIDELAAEFRRQLAPENDVRV